MDDLVWRIPSGRTTWYFQRWMVTLRYRFVIVLPWKGHSIIFLYYWVPLVKIASIGMVTYSSWHLKSRADDEVLLSFVDPLCAFCHGFHFHGCRYVPIIAGFLLLYLLRVVNFAMANEGPQSACVDVDCVFAWASNLCPRPFRFFSSGGSFHRLNSLLVLHSEHVKDLFIVRLKELSIVRESQVSSN